MFSVCVCGRGREEGRELSISRECKLGTQGKGRTCPEQKAAGLHWEVKWEPRRPQTPGNGVGVERRGQEEKGR